MTATSLYEQGHLVAAAIRILEHQKGVPPSVEDICRCLSLSSEQGHRICSRLEEQQIVEVTKGAFGTKVFLKDHLQLESLPKEENSKIADEVKKFQESRKGIDDRIAAFKAQQAEKKKNLFADLDQKLKKK